VPPLVVGRTPVTPGRGALAKILSALVDSRLVITPLAVTYTGTPLSHHIG